MSQGTPTAMEHEKKASVKDIVAAVPKFLKDNGAVSTAAIYGIAFAPLIVAVPKDMDSNMAKAKAMILAKHPEMLDLNDKAMKHGAKVLTTKKDVDSADLGWWDRTIINMNRNGDGELTNAFYVPGRNDKKYLVLNPTSDPAIISHEFGHLESHKMDPKHIHKALVDREIEANSNAPFKPRDFDEKTKIGLQTYIDQEKFKNDAIRNTLVTQGVLWSGVGAYQLAKLKGLI